MSTDNLLICCAGLRQQQAAAGPAPQKPRQPPAQPPQPSGQSCGSCTSVSHSWRCRCCWSGGGVEGARQQTVDLDPELDPSRAEPVDAGGRRHARAVQVGGGGTGSFHAVVSSGKHLATIITTTTNQSLVVPASLLLSTAGPSACAAILVTCWLYFQTCCGWFQVQTSSHVSPGGVEQVRKRHSSHQYTCSASP